MVDSGDEGSDELMCVRSDKSDLHDQQADEVPWEADSTDRVMRLCGDVAAAVHPGQRSRR